MSASNRPGSSQPPGNIFSTPDQSPDGNTVHTFVVVPTSDSPQNHRGWPDGNGQDASVDTSVNLFLGSCRKKPVGYFWCLCDHAIPLPEKITCLTLQSNISVTLAPTSSAIRKIIQWWIGLVRRFTSAIIFCSPRGSAPDDQGAIPRRYKVSLLRMNSMAS